MLLFNMYKIVLATAQYSMYSVYLCPWFCVYKGKE